MRLDIIVSHGGKRYLEMRKNEFMGDVRDIMRKASWYMYHDVVRNFLSGQKLKVRTGTLRRSVRPIYEERGKAILAGIAFGVRYARTHVGRPGTYTEIKPRRARFLAIPTEHAKTPAGVPRYSSPRELRNTFIRDGVIYQRQGERVIPMFILKRSVRVPKRIDPQHIIMRTITYVRSLMGEAT